MEKKLSIIGVDAYGKAMLQELGGRGFRFINCVNMEDNGNGSFDESALATELKDNDLSFVVANNCSAYSAKIAQYCKSLGILTLGLLPDADAAKQFLDCADSAMVVNSVADVESIAVMMHQMAYLPGHINIDIVDVRAVLKNSGLFYFGIGTAEGNDRCIAATQAAVDGVNIKPDNIIVVVSSSNEYAFTIGELTKLNDYLQTKFPKSDILWGNNTDVALDKEIRVSVLLASKR
ncbi:MAG: hypothetical protein IIT37_05565 [Bacteroidales bacterium]|nr:hypothetical protein [Bacteroidales bacterium]